MDEAFAFLKESAWVLGDAGYTVIVPAWWTPEGRRRTKVRLKTSLRSPKGAAATASHGYFSLNTIIAYEYQLSIGGQVVTEEEWQQLVNAKTSLVQFRGQWMELDRDKMQQLLQFWQTHQHEEPEITLLDMLKIGTEAEDDLEWDHDQSLRDMLSRLHDKNAFAPIKDPQNLQGSLRDYQKRGVAWLQYLENLGLNPCLADDMGLGKTLEVIARLLKEREEADSVPPTLVIAPTSVLGNWRKEIERFAPQLRTLVHQGSTRLKDKQAFAETCSDARCRPDLIRAGAPGRKALAELGVASRGGRRGSEHQESTGCPDARDSQACRTTPARLDRHACREPPARSVVHLQLPQSRLPGQGSAVPQDLRGAYPQEVMIWPGRQP
jgi:SNF2 family DNA or RNA helicase